MRDSIICIECSLRVALCFMIILACCLLDLDRASASASSYRILDFPSARAVYCAYCSANEPFRWLQRCRPADLPGIASAAIHAGCAGQAAAIRLHEVADALQDRRYRAQRPGQGGNDADMAGR